jgi:hypothetical protein
MTEYSVSIAYFHPNRHAGKSCALIVCCAFIQHLLVDVNKTETCAETDAETCAELDSV